MKIIRRWSLMLVLTGFNAHIFNLDDWQFWAITFFIGLSIGDLFNKKEK